MHNQPSAGAFQKFDANSDGVISRGELAMVPAALRDSLCHGVAWGARLGVVWGAVRHGTARRGMSWHGTA